jgi:hypothetical protein
VIVVAYFVRRKIARNSTQFMFAISCALAATSELMVAIFCRTGELSRLIFVV